MPLYGSAPIQNLESGYPAAVWNDETVPTDSASLAVSLQRSENLPNCLSAEIAFEGDPGAFKIDLEVADTNENKYFVTKASFEAGLNDFWVGRMEVTNLVAKVARLRMVSLANAVKVTARLY